MASDLEIFKHALKCQVTDCVLGRDDGASSPRDHTMKQTDRTVATTALTTSASDHAISRRDRAISRPDQAVLAADDAPSSIAQRHRLDDHMKRRCDDAVWAADGGAYVVAEARMLLDQGEWLFDRADVHVALFTPTPDKSSGQADGAGTQLTLPKSKFTLAV